MKIITYNVNGIRAAINKGFVDWMQEAAPDVICLQEIKALPEQVPVELFEQAGYGHYWFPAQKKGYSGVAILAKKKPDEIAYGMGIEKYDSEGRFMRIDYGDVSIVSAYHPSGTTEIRQEFKMLWLDDFQKYIDELKKKRPKLILCGDYNICHKPIDIHDPVRNKNSSGFLPEEREWLSQFIDSGFIDSFRHFNPEPHNYTWWSYRVRARDRNLGWRIDYNMVSNNLKDKMRRAAILSKAVHSDHCPVLLEIDI